MRIGVFGGTFDPVHIGHLVAGINVRHALGLDTVLLVVANEPWQKVGSRRVTAAEDRFAMVAAAVDGVDGLEASRLEIDRGGPSYTADTLRELEGNDLFLVVGSDVAGQISTWDRADEVVQRSELVVVSRPGEAPPPGVTVVEIPALDVSASDLRQRLADGRPVDFLIPSGALHFIRDRGLYACRSDDSTHN